MAWLDDRIQTHPKIAGLTDRAHRAWINCLCYCSMHGTGGQLDAAISVHRIPKSIVRELLRSGLWDEEDDGIWIHDWQAHNESRDTALEQRREADRERQRAHRERVRGRHGHVTDPPASRDTSRDSHVTPSRDRERDSPRGRAPTRARDHDHHQGSEGPSSSVHVDDELLDQLRALRPTPAQETRWTAALQAEPERVRACLTKATAGKARNAAALLDTMIENGSYPLEDADPEPAVALPRCPECGPIGLPPGTTLADHRRNVHGVDEAADAEPIVSTTTAHDATVTR